jgi:hypothetical protein
MDAWDRTDFATTADALDVHEARIALERVLESCRLEPTTREILEFAVVALRRR